MKLKITIILFLQILIGLFLNLTVGYANKSQGNNHTNERVYIHTDRNIYIAGENIFFKLYLSNEGTTMLQINSKIAYVVIRNETNNSIANIRLKVESCCSYGTLFLPDTLSSGYYQLLGYTNFMRNNSEELYFSKEIFIGNQFDKETFRLNNPSVFENSFFDANPSTGQTSGGLFNGMDTLLLPLPTLVISTNKKEFTKREKIKLNLEMPGKRTEILVNLSVSVFEDLPESLHDKSFQEYCSNYESASKKTKTTFSIKYLRENKDQIIQGSVINSITNKGIPKCCVLLSTIDSLPNLQYTYTDSIGLFRFPLNTYYEDKDILLTLKDNLEDQKSKIELVDKFDLKSKFIPKKINANQSFINYIYKSQDITHIRKSYEIQTLRSNQNASPGGNCPRVYIKPESVVFPADYEKLANFEEISTEILPTVKLRKHNDKYQIDLLNFIDKVYFNTMPAIFMDGVYIDDVNKFVNFGTEQIKRIETINQPWVFGSLYFNGILALFTNKPDISNVKSPTNCVSHTGSYQKSSNYLTPVYDNAKIKIYAPDFRQLLYWNPNIVITDKENVNLEFFASDLATDYIIRVEGITSDGKPVSAISKIRIKK